MLQLLKHYSNYDLYSGIDLPAFHPELPQAIMRTLNCYDIGGLNMITALVLFGCALILNILMLKELFNIKVALLSLIILVHPRIFINAFYISQELLAMLFLPAIILAYRKQKFLITGACLACLVMSRPSYGILLPCLLFL